MLLVERWAFRVDHCEAGVFLTKTWGLPEEFWLPSSNHHVAKNPAMGRSADIIRLACALAHALGYRAAPLVQTELPDVLLEQIPDLEHARVVPSLAVLSQLLESELGGVGGMTERREQSHSILVN
jgi:hypothetical protein